MFAEGSGTRASTTARAEPLELARPRLGGVAPLRLAPVADPRWLAEQADGEAGEARPGTGRLVRIDHTSATSSTVRAIGPTVSSSGTSGNTPSVETSPHCDFRPTTSQAADGRRIEQPVSVPSASSHSPAASAAAEPDDEPPVVRPGCAGLPARPVPLALAEDAPGELGQVRLADDDRAGVDEALHGLGVPLRDVVRVETGSVGRADPGRVEEVLDRERPARKRPGAGFAGLDSRDERVPLVVHVAQPTPSDKLSHGTKSAWRAQDSRQVTSCHKVCSGTSATHSISTFAPSTARRGTSTSVEAGRVSPKTSWRRGLISGRSSMSVR